MKPYRVLQIVTTMNRGGAETMIMNHYRKIPRDFIQFDFLVHRQERGNYEDEIESMGGRIFRAPKIRPWTYPQYFKWLNSFFKNHAKDFRAIHGHIQENTGFAAYFAKKYGIEYRISSSHIADLGIDYKYIFRQFGRLFTLKYSNKYLACGEDAGKFLYGKRKFEIFKNAIDSSKFVYNPEKRIQIRNQLNLNSDCFVVGNVARFGPQKNHLFLIDIFKEVVKQNSDSRLILVGDGPLLKDVENKIRDLDLENNVLLLGLREDISDILQGFDVFLMPSIFEGLPVSVIEAQAAGLPCVLSDVIDKSTDVSGLIRFVSLNSNVKEWARSLLGFKDFERKSQTKFIKEAGYDTSENIKKMINLYGCQNIIYQ